MSVMRVLPPVGGVISYGAVLGSLCDSLTGAIEGRSGRPGLRQRFMARTGLKHWVSTNSGRSALSVVLMALRDRYPGRDEVVIPAYTSYSVPAAVVRAGLRVRLCDVEMESLGLSTKDLEQEINSRTLCVVPNHLYGLPCKIEVIREIADNHNAPLIEDAAQALGVKCGDRELGTFGEAGIFSLGRGKVLPAAGGGLIGTNDETLAKRCRQVLLVSGQAGSRDIGLVSAMETTLMATFLRPRLYWIPAAMPFLKLGASIYDPTFPIRQMSRFQKTLAARLMANLEELASIREVNAKRLRRALGEINHNQSFRIIWPKEEAGEEGGFLRLPILLREPGMRTKVVAELERYGLGGSAGYPRALCDIPDLRPHLMNPENGFPVATSLSKQLITLPTHPWVSEHDCDQIAEVLRRCAQ